MSYVYVVHNQLNVLQQHITTGCLVYPKGEQKDGLLDWMKWAKIELFSWDKVDETLILIEPTRKPPVIPKLKQNQCYYGDRFVACLTADYVCRKLWESGLTDVSPVPHTVRPAGCTSTYRLIRAWQRGFQIPAPPPTLTPSV